MVRMENCRTYYLNLHGHRASQWEDTLLFRVWYSDQRNDLSDMIHPQQPLYPNFVPYHSVSDAIRDEVFYKAFVE